MGETNSIGLAELIDQVKQELFSQETGSDTTVPFFSVDQVTLELKVTVSKEGKAGLQIHVIEVGGGLSREDVHTIQVTLTPLVSKEERIQLYKQYFPEAVEAVKRASLTGGMKGAKVSEKDQFGS